MIKRIRKPSFLHVAGLFALVAVGGVLLWLYIAHARPIFSDIPLEYCLHQAALGLLYLRDATEAGPPLTLAIFLLVAFNIRQTLIRLPLSEGRPRAMAGLTIGALLLVLPFLLLATISVWLSIACLHPFNLLLIQLAVTLVLALPPKPAESGSVARISPPQAEKEDRFSRALAAMGLIVTIVTFLTTLALTQQKFRGYDALWYHLPTALQWRDLRSAEIFVSSPPFVYPQNSAIFAYFLLLAKCHSLNSALQWIATVLTAPAIYWIARRVSCPASAAVVLACSYLMMPVVALQGLYAGNDLTQALFLILALGFLVEAHMNPRSLGALLALGASAYGIAFGIKYHSLFFAPPFAAWALWLLIRERGGFRRPVRGVALGVCALLLLVLLPSVFWYGKNLMRYESPFHPYGISIAGVEIFPAEIAQGDQGGKEREFIQTPADWWRYPFIERLKYTDGWGASLALAVYPLLLLPPLLAGRFWRRRRLWSPVVLKLSATIIFGWMCWALATWREPRYNMAGYAMMFAVGGSIFAVSPNTVRWICLAFLVVALAVNAALLMLRMADSVWSPDIDRPAEFTDSGLYRAVNALPPSDIQGFMMAHYTAQSYGLDFKHRLFFSFGIDPQAVIRDNRRYVLFFTNEYVPHDPLAGDSDRFKLLAEATIEIHHFKLYENLVWRDPHSPWERYGLATPVEVASTNIPVGKDDPLTALFDGDSATVWEEFGPTKTEIEWRWANPVSLGWLDFHWGGLNHDRVNIEVRVDGEWDRIARLRTADVVGMYGVTHTYLNLDGRPFDALRIESRRDKDEVRFADQARQIKLFNINATPQPTIADRLQFGVFVGLILALFGCAFRRRRAHAGG